MRFLENASVYLHYPAIASRRVGLREPRLIFAAHPGKMMHFLGNVILVMLCEIHVKATYNA